MQENENVQSNDTPDIYRGVLNLFVGTDTHRPALMQPFFNEDYVIATDAMTLVCFDKSLLKTIDFTPHDKAPNALSIIPEDTIEPIAFDTLALKEAVSRCKEKTAKTYSIEEIECPDCKGSLFVQYKFTDHRKRKHYCESECPTCFDEETNFMKIKSIETGDTIEFFRELIQLGDAFFLVSHFEKILKAAELLSVETIFLTSKTDKYHTHKFILGECTVCITTVSEPSEEDIIENVPLYSCSDRYQFSPPNYVHNVKTI